MVIRLYNDCKEKWQSHEAHLEFEMYDEVTGYGADTKESLTELRRALVRHIQRFEEALVLVEKTLTEY
jgi:hypothetical protein